MANFEEVRDLDRGELNAIYYIVGRSLKVVDESCATCTEATWMSTPFPVLQNHSQLTILKEYRENALRHPTPLVFYFIQEADRAFRGWEIAITEVEDVKQFFLAKIAPCVEHFAFPGCHDVKGKILNKFVNLRIHVACAKMCELKANQQGGYLAQKV